MKKLALPLLAIVLIVVSLSLSTQVTSAEAVPSIQANAEGVGECSLPYEFGSHTLTIQSGGMDRIVIIYVPTGYTGKNRLPMVLNLHGRQSNAAMQVNISDMDVAAEKYNFIAVSPQGILRDRPGYVWNVPGPGMTQVGNKAPDDEMFLSDTIAYVQSILCVDAKRVYGTGYSNGGRMISQFACDHPDQIAAIAPVAGLRAGYPIIGQNYPDPATCTPNRPVPVITFAGTADMVNPYAGGGAPYWQYSAEAALTRWAEINSCNQELQTRQVTEHVKLLYYSACNENTVVQMYVAEGTGHTWPGSEFMLNFGGLFGESTFEIDATELMWQFFELHQLPGSPN